MSAKNESSYEIGFGKPPRQHQFKKGQSGNPSGRRRRKRRRPNDLLDGIAQALLNDQPIRLRGRQVVVPLFEAWAEKLIRDSFDASLRERLLLMKYLTELGVTGRLRDLKAEAEQEEPIFSDADCAMLEQIRRDLYGPEATGEPLA